MDGDRSRRFQSGAPCPICAKSNGEEKFRPFCSARCAQVDLGRWLGEKYRVETEEKPQDSPPGGPENREE